MSNELKTLIDKISITAELELMTGMHIGSSSDFAPIGAVDSIVVRDPVKKEPIIPGSTLKGKMRTLLVKTETDGPIMNDIKKDAPEIKRLFGSHDPIMHSRLQFYDLFMTIESVKKIKSKDTDLYLSEIKFENTINRTTAVANPRQIERVPAGAKFKLNLIYNVEDIAEAKEDIKNLTKAFKLLQLDYIGGHGSRGYGRVNISDFNIEKKNLTDKSSQLDIQDLITTLKGAEDNALLPV